MKTINIYTTKEERKLIDKLKVKYQLSLTTIIDVLCEITNDCLFLNADKEIEQKFKENHLYILTDKTSIKMPKSLNKMELQHPNRFANNCLHFYLRKEAIQFLKKDIVEGKYGYWNRINQELTKRVDDWWKYNEYLRYQSRYKKDTEKR